MLQAQLHGGKKLLLSNLGSLVWAADNQGHSVSGKRLCKAIPGTPDSGKQRAQGNTSHLFLAPPGCTPLLLEATIADLG